MLSTAYVTMHNDGGALLHSCSGLFWYYSELHSRLKAWWMRFVTMAKKKWRSQLLDTCEVSVKWSNSIGFWPRSLTLLQDGKKSSYCNLSFLNLCLSAAVLWVPRGLYDTLASSSPLLFGGGLLQWECGFYFVLVWGILDSQWGLTSFRTEVGEKKNCKPLTQQWGSYGFCKKDSLIFTAPFQQWNKWVREHIWSFFCTSSQTLSLVKTKAQQLLLLCSPPSSISLHPCAFPYEHHPVQFPHFRLPPSNSWLAGWLTGGLAVASRFDIATMWVAMKQHCAWVCST